MESNLKYWDEVIFVNKFVSDVIQLYPMSQYGFNCECKLCDGDGEKKEDFYFDTSKYVKISDFPNELKTNYRWNDAVSLSVHNFEYLKKVVTCIDSPTYRYKYGIAEKILHQFCLDLVMIFSERERE